MQSKLKSFALMTACALAAAGCASLPSAPAAPAFCPAPPPVAAWILTPAQDLLPMLNRLISPYELPSTGSKSN